MKSLETVILHDLLLSKGMQKTSGKWIKGKVQYQVFSTTFLPALKVGFVRCPLELGLCLAVAVCS